MNTILQLEQVAYDRLGAAYDRAEVTELVRRLLEDIKGWTRTQLLLCWGKDTLLSPEEWELLLQRLSRLEAGEPLQYILGRACFFDRELLVRPGVLIPRPETEELVAMILEHPEAGSWSHFLDVGTGSGCIAYALAEHLPDVKQAVALEVSSEAIPVAQANFEELYGRTGKVVSLWKEDLFSLVERQTILTTPLDLIVSNPPYIHPREAEAMTDNVLRYEPHLALFAPASSPLAYYEALARLLGQGYLRRGGSLWLELNPLYAEDTLNLMLGIIGEERAEGELIQDLSGKKRFLHITYHGA